MSTEEAEKYASTIRISGKTGKIKEADKHIRTLIKELESKNKEIERYKAVVELAHEHMQLYLSHYRKNHNVYDALSNLKERGKMSDKLTVEELLNINPSYVARSDFQGAIKSLLLRITELENALLEAADEISEAANSEGWGADSIDKYRAIAKGES